MDTSSNGAAASPRGHNGLIVAGIMLVVVSLGLVLSGGIDSIRAGYASNWVLSLLDEARPEPYAVDSPTGMETIGDSGMMVLDGPTASKEELERGMPVERIGDYDYIGSLAIPTIEIYLPIASKTDDARLHISPCLYSGSYLTDDLVICGEGYSSQFGFLGTVGIRDEVRFVATDGAMYRYVVSNVETSKLDDITKIMDDWDLTVFTFNVDGTCCVVRCVRT